MVAHKATHQDTKVSFYKNFNHILHQAIKFQPYSTSSAFQNLSKLITSSLTDGSMLGSSSGQSSLMLDPPRDDLQRRKDRSTRTLKMVGTCKGSFSKEIF